MRDLTPVRLTGGGTQLVLVDGEGVEYAVPIARVHQVLGNARGVQEQAESATGTTSATPTRGIRKEKVDQRMDQKMESALRPRDIQTRIRAGESPEDVAAVAGTSVEKVMIFAAPVLAERAHIARSAQSSSVRRDLGRAVVDGPHARPVRRGPAPRGGRRPRVGRLGRLAPRRRPVDPGRDVPP